MMLVYPRISQSFASSSQSAILGFSESVIIPLIVFFMVIGAACWYEGKELIGTSELNLFDKIVANAEDIGIGYADPLFIDEFGLTKANQFAMEQACNNIQVSYDRIIIDGNFNYLKQLPKSEAIIKADQKYNCVSAASIIAKVTRDRVMYRYDEQYPGYNFISNVGYPTKEHYLAIAKLGITPIHRVSFKLFR